MSFSASKTSSATPSVVTPPSSGLVAFENLRLQDDPFDAVPWPGNTYNIIEESTGQLLAAEGHGNFPVNLRLKDPKGGFAPNISWLCVEANGYFGLFNQRSNVYLSTYAQHNGLPSTFGPDQYFVPRRHPKGGYQLLSPVGNTLKQFAVVPPDATSVATFVRRQHAGTIWRFVRVSTGDN
ncbi:hypothetical protein CCMA1212_003449 [Trichoderma ghanense]|uniref:Uncharacterized protein n=1 Tax=Trichoderma ghanense TaxID=65468 RepID=A0ABY2H7I4_9HYPO